MGITYMDGLVQDCGISIVSDLLHIIQGVSVKDIQLQDIHAEFFT